MAKKEKTAATETRVRNDLDTFIGTFNSKNSYAEVATALGVTENSVKARASKVRGDYKNANLVCPLKSFGRQGGGKITAEYLAKLAEKYGQKAPEVPTTLDAQEKKETT